ncbi:MAG: hypothetical protein OQJ84_08110 [Xanthomonadales bacterium]|nr:hypothetical protein [Xanthomonadales bacterium]
MMARYPAGSTGVNTRVWSVLTALFTLWFMLNGPVFAQQAKEPSAEPATTESAPAEADAALEAILEQNNRCLRCHTRDRTKTLEDGTELSLKIHREDFIGSAHGKVACTSCHVSIESRGRHPSSKTNRGISRQRDLALEMNESCRKCHEKNYEQYQGSIHSKLVAQGSDKAPLCSDCHSAHAIQTMAQFQAETGLPCKKCHDDVYTAYRESVHGSARLNGNIIRDEHIEAPICSDCHSAHQVTAMEIGDILRDKCFACHENVPLLHSQWLPNAGTHLDVVSCAVCHAPFAKHRFDFHFYDNETQTPVGLPENIEEFEKQFESLEEQGGNIDPLAVWKLVEESNKDTTANVTLRGRLEVKSGIWAHQIAPKSFAVRTCDSCHLAGHRQRMGITVSVPEQSGKVRTFETNRESLGTVGEIQTMSDFYEMGGSRSKLLDIMFLLSLAAGIAIPIGHFTLGRMIKEKMDRGEL